MSAEKILIARLLTELGLNTASRGLRLRLACPDGIRDDLLLPQRIVGREAICEGIEYRVLCLAADAKMALKSLIGLAAEVQIVTDQGRLHSICGVVIEASAGQCDGGLATYQLVLRDVLGLMDLDTNMRVFLDKNELDIIEIILDEWRRRDPILASSFQYKFSIELRQHAHPKREFTMQYNETDAAFVRRLLKRRGIAWYFTHGRPPVPPDEDDGALFAPLHTLIMFDAPQLLRKNAAGAIRFHRADGTEKRDTITAWGAVRTLRPGRVTGFSWDESDPLATHFMTSEATSRTNQGVRGNRIASGLDDYRMETPGLAARIDDHGAMQWARMARLDYETKHFHGESTVRDLRVGEWNRVDGHAEIDSHPDEEREFVITSLQVSARNNLSKESDARVDRLFSSNRWEHGAALSASAYSNAFTCVRRGIRIVPAFNPRTDVPCAQMHNAIVVGPPGEEVHCDCYGRVKVRFPGTREHDHAHARGAGTMDTDVDSAYLRVGTSWAGNGPGSMRQFGTHTLPRVGTNVLIAYEHGDPDRPVIIDQMFNHNATPPAMSNMGELPGNRFQSGMRSREIGGKRGNQLRFDDTPGQISAQIASEHGHSALNLGWCTHPRANGKGTPRGEGAELRSDQAVSVRGANGVLISAAEQLRAAGNQLDRDGLIALTAALSIVQKQISELAGAHRVDASDLHSMSGLIERVQQWENGSNTDQENASAKDKPIVAIDAPAGAIIGSQENVSIGAQTDIDLVSVGSTQVSAGRKLLLHAMERIGIFAYKLGMKLTAAAGKVEIEAHQDDIQLTSAKRIVFNASEEIIIQAPKVTILTQGAQASFGEGAIVHQCKTGFAVKSSCATFSGPADDSIGTFELPVSDTTHDQRIQMVDFNTGEPLANQSYRAVTEDGQVFEGKTDADGLTQTITSIVPFGKLAIEALDG